MKISIILSAFALFFITVRAATPDAARVVILANADDSDSTALALHYAKARGIPEMNIVSISLPREEQITWDAFIAKVRNPLLKELVAKGFLKGVFDNTPDPEGRTRFHTSSNGIDFLVLCRGVPLKIANDPVRLEAREKKVAQIPQFAVNQASLDSELALLPRPETPLAGLVPSPWYEQQDPPVERTFDTIRVARLDGPTDTDANRLVDNAIEAERTGLMGRAYIDMGGPHPKGDKWLEATADLCRQASFDMTVENTPALIGEGARFDAPALYFGWYSQDIAGAPAAAEFRFPPGAIAIHIHSFSATTLRDAKRGWTGPLVAHGVTATVGNVEEPYLEFTHNPALFLLALLNGKTAGEAAAYSAPALSWQTVFVGDPLYRPFAHDLPLQLADLNKKVDPSLAYALIRAARKLDAENNRERADTLLTAAYAGLPVLPLAREILDREIAAGKPLSFSAIRIARVPEDPGLVADTAALLASKYKYAEAATLLERQLALGVKLPLRTAAIATGAGKPELAAKITRLYPPPLPPAVPKP